MKAWALISPSHVIAVAERQHGPMDPAAEAVLEAVLEQLKPAQQLAAYVHLHGSIAHWDYRHPDVRFTAYADANGLPIPMPDGRWP